MTTALYRAYRPERFEDVVGQQSVVRTLQNAITSDRVAHAYLFTGPKGTGKTTMAKLLAKAMNCVNGPTTEPCGECEACVAIANGSSVTVSEIDAASNNGVDDVREKIIDTVAFPPGQGSRRVYILDEAHMLSTAAFNALLKTVEEPPDHVLFIFCTTELHKMIGTVRDRCQHMAFAPPGMDQVMVVLERAAAAEKIEADEAALRAVARMSSGSFRNALGTLEHVSTAFNGSFAARDVVEHLGVFAEERVAEVVSGVLSGDTGRVLVASEAFAQEGADLESLAYSLAEYLRTLLLAQSGVDIAAEAVVDTAQLAQIAESADATRVIGAIDCISDAVARMRAGGDPRLVLETALARAAQGLGLPALGLRLARLEHGGDGVGAPVPPPSQPVATPASAPPVAKAAPAAKPAAPTATAAKPVPAAPPEPAPSPEPAAAAKPAPAAVAPTDVGDLWQQLQDATNNVAALRAALAEADPVAFDGETLTVRSSMGAVLSQGRNRDQLAEALQGICGRKVALEVRAGATGGAAPAQSASPAAPAAEAAPPQPAPTEEPPAPAPPEPIQGDGIEAVRAAFDAQEIPTSS